MPPRRPTPALADLCSERMRSCTLRRMAFGKLAAQVVKRGKRVSLVLNQLHGEPVLVVEHLGETNIEFWNDSIAKANAQAATGTGRQKLTPAKIKDMRNKNRATVARYAVRDLEVDENGQPIEKGKGRVLHDDGTPATNADIPDVVAGLPDDVFDTVLLFVQNPENFRDRPIEGDAETVAEK